MAVPQWGSALAVTRCSVFTVRLAQRFLMKSGLPYAKEGQPEISTQEAPAPIKNDMANLKLSRPDYTSSSTESQEHEHPKAQPIRVEKKVGRNDTCPCGSGKKFKQCHGK